jgi:hypothetical protein
MGVGGQTLGFRKELHLSIQSTKIPEEKIIFYLFGFQ